MCFLLKKKDEQRSRNGESPAIHVVVPKGMITLNLGRIHFDKIYSELVNVVGMCVQINFNYNFFFEMLVLSR